MNTESLCQSDSAASIQLTAEERTAAKELLACRPEVDPGTGAILNRAEAIQWFNKVTHAILILNIDPKKSTAFFDLAGAPY